MFLTIFLELTYFYNSGNLVLQYFKTNIFCNLKGVELFGNLNSGKVVLNIK